ncbi:POU class 2 homeobox associating factor 3 [Pelobates fuscus]|uniref:POU class 2 homeobox associating factor 3 n=1 Tax=Pelobates fuscus TaxID=191477 RepID=UPI002FE4AC51
MSAKPKVYQGVRVKITVKELLQQRRALQAEKNVSEIQEQRIQICDPSPLYSDIYNDCQVIPTAPSCHFQTNQLPNCISQEEPLSFLDQLFLNAYLQPEPHTENTFNLMENASLCSHGDNMQPAPIFRQNMAPESPSDSSDLSNSFEYSPTQQEVGFAPQSYSSPSYEEPRSCVFSNVGYHCQQRNGATFCYCEHCCPVSQQEEAQVPNTCYYNYTDCIEYIPSSTVTEDFFTREINNFDMCYS